MIEIEIRRIGEFLDVKIISDFQKKELEQGALLDIEEAIVIKEAFEEVIEELNKFIEQ